MNTVMNATAILLLAVCLLALAGCGNFEGGCDDLEGCHSQSSSVYWDSLAKQIK